MGKLMMSKGRPGVSKSTLGVDSGASFASEWEMLLLSPSWAGGPVTADISVHSALVVE
jgi:hypothetical protein